MLYLQSVTLSNILYILSVIKTCYVWLFFSLFYEKEGFYCKPIELDEKEFGGVAVALGEKV